MSTRSAVYNLLKAAEADSYPLIAPQELTDSYVTYSMRREPVRTQQGLTEEVSLTINIYANKHVDCVTLAATMYSGLEGKSGTYDSRTLHICNWVSESDGYIFELDKFVITQEYQLIFF
jgi:hypothetical protein